MGKSSSEGDVNSEDEVLGYIDELYSQRFPIEVRLREKSKICDIYFLDVSRKLVRIQDDPEFANYDKKTVLCGFSLDQNWFSFQAKLIIFDGKPHLELPMTVTQVERRKHRRANISARENVNVTALEGLGAGVGVFGTAVNVNVEGICIAIDRAMQLQNEKTITPSYDMLKKGTKLMVIKVNRIPGVPVFQCEAVVNRIGRKAKWMLALEFEKLPGPIRSAIEKFVQSRYVPNKAVRRSYKRRLEMQKKREMDRQPQPAESTNSVSSKEKPKELIFVQEPTAETSFKTAAQQLEMIIPVADDNEQHQDDLKFSDAEQPLKPVLISLGDELKDELSFLLDVDEYEWVHAQTPMKIIKFLNERKAGFLLIPPEFNSQSMLEYLERIAGMGVLSGVEIILFTKESLPPKDLIKSRMLGIQHVIALPLENADQVLKIISPDDYELL